VYRHMPCRPPEALIASRATATPAKPSAPMRPRLLGVRVPVPGTLRGIKRRAALGLPRRVADAPEGRRALGAARGSRFRRAS
jgi:hypothetical protein